MADLPFIEAEDLTKCYDDDTLALDHINIKVYPGEIYAMLGANGAGKTTTINLFLDFIKPTSGEARIKGITVFKEPLKAKKEIAFVSENVMLYSRFTALQNLDFFSKLSGKTDYSIEDYQEVLLRVGLPQETHRKKLKDYSKGMRQKCGIAIAILKDAPVIFLDEPSSGLDPKAGYEFMSLLKTLQEEGKAIFMSTHDIFRAKDAADVIGILKNGKLVAQKTKKELAGENLESLYMSYMSGC